MNMNKLVLFSAVPFLCLISIRERTNKHCYIYIYIYIYIYMNIVSYIQTNRTKNYNHQVP